MAKSLQEWVVTDVEPYRERPLAWLSQYHFFRDPARPTYSDTSYFFSPADGILLYQQVAGPQDAILDVKGKRYSPRDVLRDESFDEDCLVIGIFLADPLDSLNYPMLDVEEEILAELQLSLRSVTYLHNNQRMINRIDAPRLPGVYYVVQIADYDVDCITPFELRQHQPCSQGERFSQIRYGSQVELLIPLSERYELDLLHPIGFHVEAGVDPLVAVRRAPLTI
jgi:phosphatidylserine decarboxylase